MFEPTSSKNTRDRLDRAHELRSKAFVRGIGALFGRPPRDAK